MCKIIFFVILFCVVFTVYACLVVGARSEDR
jgi:hypothetical protein